MIKKTHLILIVMFAILQPFLEAQADDTADEARKIFMQDGPVRSEIAAAVTNGFTIGESTAIPMGENQFMVSIRLTYGPKGGWTQWDYSSYSTPQEVIVSKIITIPSCPGSIANLMK